MIMDKIEIKKAFDNAHNTVVKTIDHGLALMILAGILKRPIDVYPNNDGECCISMERIDFELIKTEHINLLCQYGVLYYSSTLNHTDLYLTLV